MYHHSKESYAVAASAAATHARTKMEAIITAGRQSALQVVEQVQNQVPTDRVVLARKLGIQRIGDEGFSLEIPDMEPIDLHEHALLQVSDKMDLDRRYLGSLREKGEWGQELVATNLNTLLQHSDSRHLVRTINDKEVRGFLSDRFRRIDSRPLLDAFMGACQGIGAVPIEGYALDTRVKMRAVLPYVFEPVESEVMLFGLEWGNSDYGHGGHCVSLWNMRIWCTNLALTNEVLRQVHLGKRLDDNITYSQRTYQLDTNANASALQDVVEDALSPLKVNGYLESIREAVEEKIDEKDVTRILKGKLGKGDTEKVMDLFNGRDVVNLPAGKSTYRLSNALSWFAQDESVSVAKKLELQELAGNLLDVNAGKIREV